MKRLPILLLLSVISVFAQEVKLTGIIKGKVVDTETKQPLIGVNVFITDLKTSCVQSELIE